MQSETKFSPRIFSQQLEIFCSFFGLNFVLDCICLTLNLSRTEFCLGLHTAVVFRIQSFNLKLDLQQTLK